jgi:hypothetical protein
LPPSSRFVARSYSEEIYDEIPLGKMTLCRRRAWYLTGLLLMPAAPLCGGHGVAMLLIWLVAKQARVEAAQVGLLLVPPLLLR